MAPPPGETLEGWCVRHGLGRRSALICSKLRAHDVDAQDYYVVAGGSVDGAVAERARAHSDYFSEHAQKIC